MSRRQPPLPLMLAVCVEMPIPPRFLNINIKSFYM